ncbi:MAG: isocitrate/isopropylmalate family dehydrogenase [Pseudomonadota bacterium]
MRRPISRPSMFEKIDISAPDIGGKGIASPITANWTAAMRLEHLGETEDTGLIDAAMETVPGDISLRTRDCRNARSRRCGGCRGPYCGGAATSHVGGHLPLNSAYA